MKPEYLQLAHEAYLAGADLREPDAATSGTLTERNGMTRLWVLRER